MGKRAAKFAQLSELSSCRKHLAMTSHTNSSPSSSTDVSTPAPDVILVSSGEQLVSDYQIHKLPQKLLIDNAGSDIDGNNDGLENMVALKARIEFLEAEKKVIEKQLESVSYKPQYFRLEQIGMIV